MKLLSWNVHGFVGGDGVYDPDRIVDVLGSLRPAIAALQEVDLRQTDTDLVSQLRGVIGPHSVSAPAMGKGANWYGQVLLSRYPVVRHTIHDLSFLTAEPRRLIEAVLDIGGGMLRVLAAHLGLKRRERAYQFNIIRAVAATDPTIPVVLMGDLNEWLPAPRTARRVLGPGAEGTSPMIRTFPAKTPLFPLDRMMSRPGILLKAAHAVKHVRLPSDHLPLLAQLNMDALHAVPHDGV